MIKNRDIVIIGIQAWDIEIGSNCKNIAAEFAKHNRVLYVNPPLDRATMKRESNNKKIQKRIAIKKGKQSELEVIDANFWNLYPKTLIESINWLPFHTVFKYLNKKNTKKFAADIQRAITVLDFKDIILFNDSSMFLGRHIKKYLKPEQYVYYMRDYLIKVPYWAKHGERIEPQTIKEADIVVNNSVLYKEYGKKYNPHSYMVGQGCDVSLFSDDHNSITIPHDLKDIKKPILGYVGYLTSMRLDIGLLEYIGRYHKDWSIVLVGPEDDDFQKSQLHAMENVYFLGRKKESELPAYVKGFDVAMNPQVVNDWTIGNYPRKIDEYLAMGKPTIATATKAMEMFADHVYLGSTKEDYVTLIQKALSENTEELEQKRIAFAKSHTWENNVIAIADAINKTSKNTIDHGIKR